MSRIEEIEEELQGTCQSLSDVLENDDLPQDDVETELGERGNIELCESCGWWCETSEMEDETCEDCRS